MFFPWHDESVSCDQLCTQQLQLGGFEILGFGTHEVQVEFYLLALVIKYLIVETLCDKCGVSSAKHFWRARCFGALGATLRYTLLAILLLIIAI